MMESVGKHTNKAEGSGRVVIMMISGKNANDRS
jgi:hypothetical protein